MEKSKIQAKKEQKAEYKKKNNQYEKKMFIT